MPSSTKPSPASTPGPSRRPPSKLRVPTSSRKASNPSLSLVYASPGPSMPQSSGSGSGSSSSTSRSEEALSRQLDGDLGGKQMGLRSRRSSSATIRTISTINGGSGGGGGPQSPRESIMEEDEDSASGGGPILERRVIVDEPLQEGGRMRTRLNPKVSSSWLRWNSPTPSFPKSDKGKGKERERADQGDVTPVRRASTIGSNSLERQSSRLSSSTSKQEPLNDPAPRAEATITDSGGVDERSQPPNEADKDPPDPAITIPPPTRKARGWFSRNPPPQPKAPPSITDSSHLIETDQINEAPNKPQGGLVAQPNASNSPTNVSISETAAEAPAKIDSSPQPASDIAPDGDLPDPTKINGLNDPVAAPKPEGMVKPSKAEEAITSRGWAGYLSWGRGRPPPTIIDSTDSTDAVSAVRTMPAAESATYQIRGNTVEDANVKPKETAPEPPTSSPIPAKPVSRSPETVLAPTEAHSAESSDIQLRESDYAVTHSNVPSTLTETGSRSEDELPTKSTWGNFLYNIVIPQTREPSIIEPTIPKPSDESTAPVSSPTEEQRPLHIETESAVIKPDIDLVPPTAVPEPSQPAETPSQLLATSPAGRKGSQASTTAGWLSYLAFRASQKKVTQTVSVNTADTTEEVMDFSTDPNFPTNLGGPSTMPTDKTAEITASPMPKNKVSDSTMKPPTTIPKRDKRLSTSSLRSATSVTPIPPSPRSQSKAETATATPTPSIKGPSSLPPPPQSSQQPNLVIPTFSTTFDRPPRSVMPLLPPKPAPVAEKGGLAWRAFGAVGSYVYSGAGQEVKAEPKVDDDAKESRGRREGRKIGANLPRRIGMDGGHPDDGWKNVKRVVVVGVHGWFPAKMLNSVIGEPTGTSSKFTNMMGQAVRKFFDDKGVDDIRLTLIPLEGEGTIEHRVDRLYKSYLSNPAWINDLRRADAVFFAAHSQGCIVTTHLLSRLIAQGHIKTPLNAEAVARCSWAFGPVSIVPPSEPRSGHTRQAHTVPVNVEEGGYQKVCMLAMCGVHQGPLYSISTSNVIQPYLNWFENAAAKELFEFQDTTSAVSQAYQRALSMVLENDVRVVLLSSLNDQVVPIYGSSFSAATHPLLLRALFVDGASYSASDFMTNLLCFAFMLRNAGISDEHLIEHLSEATAGSLTGLGHSAPYEDPATFRLAVDYLFHAGPVQHMDDSTPTPELQIDHFSARDGRNVYEVPWIMRALVDSPEVKDLFPGELRDLKEGIMHWKPTTKTLRDIKKRLEPMAGRQSKLRALTHSPSSTSLNSNAEPGTSPGSKKHLAPPIGLRKDW